jgi:hypothetical protein
LSHVYPVSPSHCPWINIPNNTWRRIKHCATSRMVAGSIPNGVNGIFLLK